MELTPEQRETIRSGGAVRLNEAGTDVVVLRADVYERLRHLLDGDTVYTTAEMLDRVMADDDANDPQLAAWQEKYGGVRE